MATSLIGPCLVSSALAAAPVPRPPQPTRATWIVLFSAACTEGIVTPARAEAVATVPVVLRKSRRDSLGIESVMLSAPWGDRARARVGLRAGCGIRQVGLAARSRERRGPRAGFGRLQRATDLGPGAVTGELAVRTFDVLNKFNMPFAFLQVVRNASVERLTIVLHTAHTNSTRQRGECLRTLAGAVGLVSHPSRPGVDNHPLSALATVRDGRESAPAPDFRGVPTPSDTKVAFPMRPSL